MCDILHARHVKAYLRFDALFNMTSIKQKQEKLLAIIHGLTKRVSSFLHATKDVNPEENQPRFHIILLPRSKVIKEKKEVFERNYRDGALPTPSLSEIIADDYVEKSPKSVPAAAKAPVAGLRDDLDDIDENDIGECFQLF